jgi:hypothetical protein
VGPRGVPPLPHDVVVLIRPDAVLFIIESSQVRNVKLKVKKRSLMTWGNSRVTRRRRNIGSGFGCSCNSASSFPNPIYLHSPVRVDNCILPTTSATVVPEVTTACSPFDIGPRPNRTTTQRQGILLNKERLLTEVTRLLAKEQQMCMQVEDLTLSSSAKVLPNQPISTAHSRCYIASDYCRAS